jgi:curved DNA-binding protein CbpA
MIRGTIVMLTNFEDKYALLQVAPSASTDEINTAFRAASRLYHPDKLPIEQQAAGEAIFKQISAARDVLVNPKSRAKYDTEWRQNKLLEEDEKRKAQTEHAQHNTTNSRSNAQYARNNNPGFGDHAREDRMRPGYRASESQSQRIIRMRHEASRKIASDKACYEAAMRAREERELREQGAPSAPEPMLADLKHTADSLATLQKLAEPLPDFAPFAAAASDAILTPPSTSDPKRKRDGKDDECGNCRKLRS